MTSISDLTDIAKEIRTSIIKSLVPNESHHIGCSLGIVELLTYLYFKEMLIDPAEPNKPERDRFILSKGHAGIALFATLAERGFFSKEILNEYDTDGGKLPEHVSMVVPGVELSTGSLGHGLPVGVGLAYAAKYEKKARRSIVLISDGELDEGSNWEAIMFAGHHQLGQLIAIVDQNGFQGYGTTEKILDLSPLSDKVTVFGWKVAEIDGHDFEQMSKVFQNIKSRNDNKPTMIIAKTIKGKGIPHFEGKFESHYHSIDQETKDEILKLMETEQ